MQAPSVFTRSAAAMAARAATRRVLLTSGSLAFVIGLAMPLSAWAAGVAGASGSGVVTGSGQTALCSDNTPPSADAGADRQTVPSLPIHFDGSNSHDPNGSLSSFAWDFGDGAMGHGAQATHSFATGGEYEVTLTVTDNCGASDSHTILVTVSEGGVAGDCSNNTTPIANAGPDRTGSTGTAISFNGSSSYDPDGSITSYWWNYGDGQFTGWQANATVSHSYASQGTYTVRLWVKDDCNVFSLSDQAVVTITGGNPCAGNVSPAANAGSDRSANVNQSVSFTGSGTDSDGSITIYSWAFGDGSTASGASVSHAYATAGTFTATLTVTDNCGATSSDSAIVSVSSGSSCANNQAPTANAGPDRQGTVGAPVTLSGTASSDPNGNISEYWWNFGNGQYTGWQPNATVTHTYANQGTFSARLWVRDACGLMSMSDTAIVSIGSGTNPCANNQAPTANAGPNLNGTVGAPVSFSSAGSSDGDGTIQSYAWNFGNGQTGSGSSAAHTYATAGTYTVTLTVTDNCGATGSDTASVTIAPSNPCTGNTAPFASAGSDQSTTQGTALSFSAAGSTDLNNNISSYSWNFGNGQTAAGANVSYTYPAAGNYTVTLTVTDACNASDTDTASVTINPLDPCANNTPPTANAGPDRTGTTNTPVTLTGSGTDANGSITSYWWNFGDGQSTGWQSSSSAAHTYTTANTFTATLWVRDNCGASSPADTAVVTISQSNPCAGNTPPIANAGPDRTVQVGTPITFSGSGSTDVGGTIQSYAWNFGNGSTASGLSVTHTYSTAGSYTVSLTVTDNCNAPHTDQAVVTVSSQPPTGLDANYKVYRLVSVNPQSGAETWQEINLASEQIDVGTHLKFDASISQGTIGFASWAMGDGSYQTGLVAYYQYLDTGSYSVELSIFDPSWANSDTSTKVLTVGLAMDFLDSLPLADDNSNDIAIDGTLAFTSHLNGKLTTINIANPSSMTVLSTIAAPVSKNLAASNGHVYLCASGLGVQIYQATVPTPTIVGTYNTSAQDGQSAKDAAAIGKVLFLAAGPAGFKVVNMTTPSSPSLLGSRLLPGNTNAEVILVSGGKAYVADNAAKIHIYDVSAINTNNPSPSTPVFLKTMSVGWLVHQMALSGNTLIAQANPGGMFLYDVSNPSDPNANQLGYLDIASEADGLSPGGIIAVGNSVYAGFGPMPSIGTSVCRVSIADPTEPYVMEFLPTSQVSGTNRGPVQHNGILFFANSRYKAISVDVP